jgi:hypothetical protein
VIPCGFELDRYFAWFEYFDFVDFEDNVYENIVEWVDDWKYEWFRWGIIKVTSVNPFNQRLNGRFLKRKSVSFLELIVVNVTIVQSCFSVEVRVKSIILFEIVCIRNPISSPGTTEPFEKSVGMHRKASETRKQMEVDWQSRRRTTMEEERETKLEVNFTVGQTGASFWNKGNQVLRGDFFQLEGDFPSFGDSLNIGCSDVRRKGMVYLRILCKVIHPRKDQNNETEQNSRFCWHW